ncbi:hypothetical protein [Algoriphagus marinus]|uniref:hypothetical protein n=1 Tax=Algoriphagus marinus TaxID=1925762 RepID=UPI000AA39729|nr:hypothetical protein [Algoriphagus marinus]
MKNLQSLFVLIFFLVTASCTNATSFQFEGEPYLSQSFSINGPGDLKVETSGSSVRLRDIGKYSYYRYVCQIQG